MIKEPTASTFVFCQKPGGRWRTALVRHPRLGCWLPAGGHVEHDETPAEAAVREALEETGLQVRLLPGPATPVPASFPRQSVPAPWWVTEMPAAPDSHTRVPHIHVDYVYLAVAPTTRPAAAAAHQVRWFTADELAMASGIAEDSRLQATDLFTRVNSLPPSPSTAPARTDAEVGAATKSQNTRLIVLRGNSASGKSSVAAGIRDRYGRGIAIVVIKTICAAPYSANATSRTALTSPSSARLHASRSTLTTT